MAGQPLGPLAPRSVLYLPASNARALAKARTLPADMLILDLEDAVPEADKDTARAAALAAVAEGFGERIATIRINAADSPFHAADIAAVAGSAATAIVIPKVEAADTAERVAQVVGRPVLAMIETPAGLLAAAAIAAAPGVCGLIAGTNDIAHALRLPPGAGRGGLALALQTIVLAARAADGFAFDGVWNRLDDPDGFDAECREGRDFGFDGKTLIHPNQVEPANRAFSPSAAEIEDARALIAAAGGGAVRFRDRMVEDMHVATARALLARA
jgi:citrate lyase subunit beta/citryl-CoA lyase